MDPIKHVVVLMFENHSFDQMLGSLQGEIEGLDGVNPKRPGFNLDANGGRYEQRPTHSPSVSPDPIHETINVLRQLDGDNAGFVRDYENSYGITSPETLQQIMNVFEPNVLPALHDLARHFTICDQWFSSVPGPTWANRFFVHTGTSLGKVRMPAGAFDSFRHPERLDYDQDTIFDRLNEAGVTWRVYHGDIPQSLVLKHQRTPQNASHYSFMGQFEGDTGTDDANFPSYCFIEPSYYFPGQNDDHPPHTTMDAQRLLARVYAALRGNKGLWESTLFVVLYDEHGGFYDHVAPPSAVSPDGLIDVETGFRFDRLGVRVPVLLISPWVEKKVVSDVFDHTSLLRYLSDKWGLRMLTDRVENAKSFASCIRRSGEPRDDTPPPVLIPRVLLSAEAIASDSAHAEPLNAQQEALIAFALHLQQHEIDVTPEAPIKALAAAGPPMSQVESAKMSVNDFLRQQKMKATVVG
jgi:phospholipase C